MSKSKPNIARVDPHTPESGLFKVRPKNAPRLHAEEFITVVETEDGPLEIKYATPYALNHVDLRIFLAAVGMCSADPEALAQNDTEPAQKGLWDKFLTKGIATNMPAAKIKTTSYALAKAAGIAWGDRQAQRISDSLEKMASVSSTWRRGSKVTSGSQMLSFAHDEDSRELVIAISPHFAKAILGEANRYIQISLSEMRELKHPAATVLHMVISSRLGLGGKRKNREMFINIDKLAEACYGTSKNAEQTRQRRKQIAAALEELHQLDYWFTTYNPDTHKVHIHRTKPDNTHLEDMMKNVEKIEKELNKED